MYDVICLLYYNVVCVCLFSQDNCAPLLRYVSHSEFKDLVLPALQKSLLRSPENAIESELPVEK